MKRLLTLTPLLALFLWSCGDDDSDGGQPAAMADFTVTVENVTEGKDFFASGVFNTPDGAGAPGPAMPGSSYSFSFYAGIGHKLTFATMFVQSNDLFYGPGENGIDLFDANGNALTGDITSMIDLWDAGTEVNEEPYVGPNQAPRQGAGDTGMDENGTVELISNVADGFTYPADEDIIQVMLTNSGSLFTLTINNISADADATPFAPGVFIVFSGDLNPLFTEGQADVGNGLEGVAEDGAADDLGNFAADNSGIVSPMAPGVFVVHEAGVTPLFTNNTADFGQGLEALAEDGDPGALATNLESATGVLSSGAFNTPQGSAGPGPLFPGESYTFSFTAMDGAYLNFATMFVQSNDLFYAFDDGGIALFNNGNPVTGDVTSELSLWDAGTEVNEFPGAGNNQAPRQSGPDTGDDETGNVELVNDGFTYPADNSVIRVTITAQ